MSDKSNNKTWWKLGERRINLAHLTDIYFNNRRPAIFIHMSNEKSGEVISYAEDEEGFEQAEALLDYIDEELSINYERNE